MYLLIETPLGDISFDPSLVLFATQNRLFHLDANGSHHAVTNIGILEIAIKIFFYRSSRGFAKSRKMRPSLCGMLTVYKRIMLLAILIGMGNSHFNIVSCKWIIG